MRKNQYLTFIAVLAFAMYFAFNNDPNMAIGAEYFFLMPYLLIIGIGIYSVKNTSHGANNVLAYIFLGASIAYFAGVLNTNGIWVNTMIVTHGLTIQYLQVLLIIGSTLVGIYINS